jgi:divalent metal cation (Fe/Co/Zn/Cd) transporter
MFSREELVGSAIRLSFLTIAWNAIVGAAAFVSAVVDNSLSLGGFALNMLIDTSASAMLVWRFKTEARDPLAAYRLERHAQTGISIAMLAVAVYVAVQSIRALIDGSHPEASVLGVTTAAASLVFLPWLARQKLRVAHLLHSRALRGDGILSAASAALAAVTLAALTASSLLGWWWADPVAALLIALALVIEASRLAAHRLGSAEPEVQPQPDAVRASE